MSNTAKRNELVSFLIIGILVGAVGGAFAAISILPPRIVEEIREVPKQIEKFVPSSSAQNVRSYTLIIKSVQLTVGDKTWEAWTYNGTVPAPTLRGQVGDILRIRVINTHNLIHSVHTHLSDYAFEMDGTQANIIAGKGVGAMIPPGKEYTYEFQLSTPGIYYFHCHSSDGGKTIHQHINMGLYGALIVDEKDRAPANKEFALFYSEGQPGAPAPWVINNRGIPGGEHTLEQVFLNKGLKGVIEQFNVTTTVLSVKKGDVVRVHVINIGDVYHSHHQHNFQHRSLRTLHGDVWAGNVLPLLPGQADTLEFTATQPGIWLFHCHVVSHADQGMIGAIVVQE